MSMLGPNGIMFTIGDDGKLVPSGDWWKDEKPEHLRVVVEAAQRFYEQNPDVKYLPWREVSQDAGT